MAEWVKEMAKIIVSSRYVRNTPKRSAANLVRYMGTREGVEKVPVGIEDGPATVRQQRLIKDLLETDADAKNTFEYQDYENNPTKQNATEFIDAFIERNADRTGEIDKLVKYMAERPGVEKLGPHGLFNQYDDKIDLDSVAEEVGQHQGVVWTHVVSLHREDAERLGYNKAEVWKDLVRRNMTELAKAHKIDLDQLQWYAAFHNTTHHPHIHLLVYANGQDIRFHVDRCPMCGRRFDEKEDYLSIENGDDVWYVDYEENRVEHGIISSVTYKEGRVYVFFVEWDDGDGDEYDGYGLGRHYFLKQANALEELRERKYE